MPVIKMRTRRLTVEWKASSSSVWATAFATGACSATFKFMEKLSIVAPDNKPPSAHWDRFTVAGRGDMTPKQHYENWDSSQDNQEDGLAMKSEVRQVLKSMVDTLNVEFMTLFLPDATALVLGGRTERGPLEA